MAASLPHGTEAILFKNSTNLQARKARSLPNRHLNLSHEYLVMSAPGDLRWRCRFKEQRECFDQVGSGLFNRRTLARDIELRAQRHETVVLTLLDDPAYVVGLPNTATVTLVNLASKIYDFRHSTPNDATIKWTSVPGFSYRVASKNHRGMTRTCISSG